MVHIGSWGLPDFGFTEALNRGVSKVTGYQAPLSSQGGSELALSPQQYQTSVAQPMQSYAQSTYQSAPISQAGNYVQAQQSQNNIQNNPGGGGLSGQQNVDWYINEFGNQVPINKEPSQPSWEDQMRGNIENVYGNYARELDAIMGGLDPQAEAQRGIVQNQYQQGVNTLTSQKDIGMSDLGRQREITETTQNKTMKDLAEAMRNQFMSGQVMLGAKGAGDSSAVDQYSYALTKLGNKQRGDVAREYAGIQNEINDREFKLKNIYDTEINNIALERDSKLGQISQWFAEQQNQIRQLIAEGGLRKGQDLNALAMNAYNQAINAANQINAEAYNRRSMLEQWAMNNSANIRQLKQNMAAISGYQANPPAFQGLNASWGNVAGQNNPGSFGVSSNLANDEEQRGIFG